MDWQDGLDLESGRRGTVECRLQRRWRQQPVVRIDIGEDDFGAGHAHGIGGSEEGDGWHDRRIARPEFKGEAGEMQRRRAR